MGFRAATGKGAGGKKYAEQRTVNIRSYPSANSVNPSVTVTVNSMKKRYACTVLNRLMPVTDAVMYRSGRGRIHCL